MKIFFLCFISVMVFNIWVELVKFHSEFAMVVHDVAQGLKEHEKTP